MKYCDILLTDFHKNEGIIKHVRDVFVCVCVCVGGGGGAVHSFGSTHAKLGAFV